MPSPSRCVNSFHEEFSAPPAFPFLRSLRPAALDVAIELASAGSPVLLLHACGLGDDVRDAFIDAAIAERSRREGRAGR